MLNVGMLSFIMTFVVMQPNIMLCFVMLNADILNVVRLSVVAPYADLHSKG
jgi:hypothetical protein